MMAQPLSPRSSVEPALPPRRFWIGFWRLADPKISLASLASMLLGALVAARDGPLHPGWLALTVLGIVAIEVAKNASGEIFDYESGTDQAVAPEDRSPFSGGKRVLVDRLLTRRETAVISVGAYLAGVVAGLWIVGAREPRILWIGLTGLASAYFYHAPPLRLSYRGLGELAVAICYGPLIAVGTYLVQRGQVAREIVLPSLSLGLLIAAFLWINEFPDYAADLASGKRTLVTRLGRKKASRAFAALVAIAFGWLAALPWLGLSPGVWAGFVAAAPAIAAVRRLWTRFEQTPEVIPAQTRTLQTFLLFALATGLGLLWR
jgi:1,4-dihydroxy-2-naphthoate polyprenyltransferase